ncbi:MAG: radical SAM protein, partial [bacterium]
LGVFEVALGGGEPTLHPNFIEILKFARKCGIIPNLATNGAELSAKNILGIARYAGAVALSVEFIGDEFEKRRGFAFETWLKSYKKLKRVGVRVVFQLTVSQANIADLPKIIDYLYQLQPYGIIFLTFKPYGRGLNFDAPLSTVDLKVVQDTLRQSISDSDSEINIGYDCCLGNGLVGLGLQGDEQIKGCSAMRSSLAINANLDVVPCSFTAQPVGNLEHNTIKDIWLNQAATDWRNRFVEKIQLDHLCSSCKYNINCLGGCPEFKLVKCYKEKSPC